MWALCLCGKGMLLNIVSKWPLHSQRIRGGCLVWSNFTISTNGLRIPAISVSQIVGMAAFVPPTLECVVCRISLALNLCVCVFGLFRIRWKRVREEKGGLKENSSGRPARCVCVCLWESVRWVDVLVRQSAPALQHSPLSGNIMWLWEAQRNSPASQHWEQTGREREQGEVKKKLRVTKTETLVRPSQSRRGELHCLVSFFFDGYKGILLAMPCWPRGTGASPPGAVWLRCPWRIALTWWICWM